MRNRKHPNVISINARRWFQKGPGNTYHSVSIGVNGKTVHTVPFAYGYGSHYLETARSWLKKNGFLAGIEEHARGSGEPLWRYCERIGCTLVEDVSDVSRRSDLHRRGR